jgi:schlafen family protein
MTAYRVEEALEAPEEDRGERLLALEEDQWFDRKSARIVAKNLGAPLVAFANAEGGTIVVGLSDGKVEGLEDHRTKVNSIRQAAIDFTDPPVQATVTELPCINHRGESDFLLVITVERSEQVHQLKNGDCYLRIGDETRKLRFPQRRELENRRGQIQSPPDPRPAARNQRSHSTGSSSRADSSYLGKKLELIARQQPTRIVLVGGVYLDLMLYPIDTIMLEDREWGNLQSIKMQLGGSAYYLGKYLYEQFGQKSELLTIVGSTDDPLSREAARLLQGESWVRNNVIIDKSPSAIPVSVHLVQRSEAYTTIFTHRGALDHLSWDHVFQGSTAVSHDEPAIIYVSAYFRSNLHLDLERKLRELSRRHVVALAHGRVNPETDNPQSAVALKEAFNRGYVDVYFCTFGQLWALDKSPTLEEPIPIESRTHEFIEEMAQRLSLPPVTVIRGEEWPGEGTAYLLLDGQLHVVSEAGAPTGGSIGGVGPKNAFNASFLMSLIENGLTHDTVVDAVHAGLRAWINSG